MNVWRRLAQAAETSPRLMIGIMSGTSADGTDAALVRLSDTETGTAADLISFASSPFPGDLRKTILDISRGEGNAEAVSRLSVALAEEYSRVVFDLRTAAGLEKDDAIVAIGCHGQTVSHTPYGPYPSTLQIVDAATLAIRTGLPVVSNFRAADVAVGGQGAPLTPFVDWKLLTHPVQNRAIQNIGGIANVTYLPANGTADRVIGFDTGPGNMLIDLASQWATDNRLLYDHDGQLASSGTVVPEFLQWLLEHPFLAIQPPKSAGREEFGAVFWRSQILPFVESRVASARPEDVVATITAFTAYSIAAAYSDYLPARPDEVIVCGGGANNRALMHFLIEAVSPVPVRSSYAVGIHPQAREAIAFAVLADEVLQGRPANLPSVTGATRAVLLGSVTVPH